HLVRYRARADALQQRRDRRGMAQPRAMVDVVGAKAGAHELLEETRLLVRSLGRAVSGERVAILVADLAQPLRRCGQRLVPARFAEHLGPVAWIDDEVGGLGHAGLADER